jgi:hypothetical protein
MVVHHNYLKAICMQETTVAEKISCIIATMDSLVVSDVIEKTMYNTQCWFLQPIQGYASTYIPNYYINKHPKTAVAQSEWASVLSVSSQSQNLKKNARDLQYNVHSYTITDVQSLIEITFQLFVTQKYEHAVRHIVYYKLCNLDEFKTKKAVTVIDKIAKFIKLSRYHLRWSNFKETIKNDKMFDKKIQELVMLYNDEPKFSKAKLSTLLKPSATIPARPAILIPTTATATATTTTVKKPILVVKKDTVCKTIVEQQQLATTRKTVAVLKKRIDKI